MSKTEQVVYFRKTRVDTNNWSALRRVIGRVTLCTAKKDVRKEEKLIEGDALGALLLGDAKEFVDMGWERMVRRDEWGFSSVAALVGYVCNLSNSTIREGEPVRGKSGL